MTAKGAIAVLSDVHSNVYALDAVLADIAGRGIERIVNLGDVLFGPIAPLETAQRLMAEKNVISIMGNCDRILLEEESESLTFQQVKPLLSQAHLEWIRTFRKTWVFEDILFCHGTPFSDETYLLEEVTERGAGNKALAIVAEQLQSIEQRIIVCGHTHLPKSVQLPDGKLVLNPGSVGFPAYYEESPHPHVMESMSPHAKYAILWPSELGWTIEQIMLPYDWEQASRVAEDKGRPDYGYAIRTGFAYMPVDE
ncbi:metallophosphoesterase family protein [Brevibacillus choshinensis]|uniref:Metallophosphoesterase family protein n=1 Tax=Brevibacillus choshinensis TaxID=54911 RepID=A0ABX7FNI8_BRECH|nr:metallophosphoesterase family protein [Brevibacillus choshinensis]QRG67239.1 metallophosphoesterase family protein [Brevibacillus choshinensis]